MGAAMTANKKPPSRREKRMAIPPGLWSRGMIATLGAQFLSALADNALLFAALALVRKGGYPVWVRWSAEGVHLRL
jgi:hypothetical protein